MGIDKPVPFTIRLRISDTTWRIKKKKQSRRHRLHDFALDFAGQRAHDPILSSTGGYRWEARQRRTSVVITGEFQLPSRPGTPMTYRPATAQINVVAIYVKEKARISYCPKGQSACPKYL
ncbi:MULTISPECIES: hypothetical protein [unclassified Paraburkholderia]|uniref:hypothetical protein n=1 Tax=unclassified Paraburkholderia TaxID=2615204 RepID=UPI00184434F0|nr:MULTISPECIES: hypothetical protein [unclassified Paraburkholderia]MBB5411461.1 hypothetical protein [Paraburkholderia sp. HC6.4b]MBB5449995.1 hypothetical protein [Paraburkholderia sp. Kb1A]